MTFGEFIRNKRLEAGFSLRRFCEVAEVDPSNWSKIERGFLPATVDRRTLEKIAKLIRLPKEDWEKLFDLAALTQERIPEDIAKHKEKMTELPEVFKKIRDDMRISVPKLKVEKFKNVLLYILERCAGKPNVGETVLYKLLYFSDFNYYELYEEQLTGASYRKLPHGPVPFRMDYILKGMEENGELAKLETEYYGLKQKRYMPLVKPDLTKLKASEIEVIDHVIDQLSDMNAKGISLYSHNDMPWRATKDGEEIDYELVFYRTMPYSQRVYEEGNDVRGAG